MTAGPSAATKYHNPDTGLSYLGRGLRVPSQAVLDLVDALDEAAVPDDCTVVATAQAALDAAEVEVEQRGDLLNALNFRRRVGSKYREAVAAGWFLRWTA